MSLHPRTAVGPGRYAGLLLTPNWQRWSGRSRHTYFTASRQRAKSTAAPERIGQGGATHQTANLCSKLNCASLPRPRDRAGARLFQQPDLENHWVPMRNRALPSVMVFVAKPASRGALSVRRLFSRPTPHAPRLTACWLSSDAARQCQHRRLVSPAFGCGPSPSSAGLQSIRVFNQVAL